MALLNYMQKNKFGVYEFRRRVPTELLDKFPQFKCGIIKHSLKTKDAAEAKRLNKRQDAIYEEMFSRAKAGDASATPIERAVVKIESGSSFAKLNKSGVYLSDLEARWKQEGGRTSKTEEAMHRLVIRFDNIVGRLDVVQINRQHVRDFRDSLAKELTNRKTQSETLSKSTINKYITNLGVLLNVGINDGLEVITLGRGLKLKKSVKERTQDRQPFTENDLDKIFSTGIYTNDSGRALVRNTQGNVGDNSRYWLPILAYYTGARLEELALLTVNDVKTESDVQFIDINTLDEKSVKTVNSIRKVPMHNDLISLGFVDYCNSLVRAGIKLIFHDLVDYKGKRSHYFSKWFSYHKNKLGIVSELTVFHSFRHTFIDACRNSGIPRAIYQRLTGHNEEKNTGDGYGKGNNLKSLNEYMQTLVLPYPLLKLRVQTEVTFNPAPLTTPFHGTITTKAKPLAAKDLLNAVSLAEAYNTIGKKLFGKKWKNYHIVTTDQGGALKSLDLSSKTRLNHKGIPELKALFPEHIRNLNLGDLDEEESLRYNEVMRFLMKGLTSDGLVSYYKPLDSEKFLLMPDTSLSDFGKSLPFSHLLMQGKGGNDDIVEILVNKDSLENYVGIFG